MPRAQGRDPVSFSPPATDSPEWKRMQAERAVIDAARAWVEAMAGVHANYAYPEESALADAVRALDGE